MADLNRFLDAHKHGLPQHLGGRPEEPDTFEDALAEIKNGKKKWHWIWYVFPQIKLGKTDRSKCYSVNSLDEINTRDEAVAFVVAFLAHPVLGQNYREIVAEVWRQVSEHGNGVKRMFGEDFKKFRSSLTLFEWAAQTSGDTALAAQCANILEQAATEPGIDDSTRCEATQAFLIPPMPLRIVIRDAEPKLPFQWI